MDKAENHHSVGFKELRYGNVQRQGRCRSLSPILSGILGVILRSL